MTDGTEEPTNGAAERWSQVLERIDAVELTALAVELGNVYSPAGQEGPACDYVFDWYRHNGFEPELIGLDEERANVVGRLRGSGGGCSLIFNSHLDNIFSVDDKWMFREPDRDVFVKAWLDDDGRVWGYPVVNCKGPMACWMIAAKAIKESGVGLRGDLILTSVVGEIDLEPVDEFQGLAYNGEDIGARYMISHGILADYALVAEATNFAPGLVEAGKAFFKITVLAGPSRYTPLVERPTSREESRSAIVQMTRFVERFEEWANHYGQRYTLDYDHGTVVPRASIGAIRGGMPTKVYRPPELCSIYVDVRLNPDTSPLEIEAELREVARNAGVEADVKPYLYRRGYEASGVEPLLGAVTAAHEEVLGRPIGRPDPHTVSMWRDTNPFNELGIPSLTYGPGLNSNLRPYFDTSEMVDAAKVYALTALDICNRDPTRRPLAP